MGSCFRPTRVDPATGQRLRYRRYRIVWADECGRRCSEMAYKDKAASRAMLERKEREVARRIEGLAVADLAKRATPAAELIASFARELVSRGSEPGGEYVRVSRQTLTAVFKGCGWVTLGDVRRDGLCAYLAQMAAAGKAPGTRGRHLMIAKSLTAWAKDQGWLAEDPLAGLKPPRLGDAGRRKRRRAFSRDELLRLLSAAPERRSRAYRLAALSGFRRVELGRMEKRDFHPVGDRPIWRLRAEAAKNRRLDVVPIVPDALPLALELWQSLPAPTSRLVSSPLLCGSVPDPKTVNRDLAAAGIPKRDGEGRWADFHSLRYTFCRLMSGVCPIQVVKVLMRHASIQLTCDLYGELGIDEAGEAVWALPKVL